MNNFHLLHTESLSRFYPGVRALDSVDFDLRAGEVHVLFGENGAGKSTLISLLAGANSPTAGSIHVRGVPMRFTNVHAARNEGVSSVFQEFSLIPTLTVAQNLCLGEEPMHFGMMDNAELQKQAQRVLEELGFEIHASALVSTLNRAQQQMVEIAKGLRGHVSVLILDEPTASLTERETERLFSLVARLKAQGVGIVYISHRMQEIDQIADRVTVLRDGKKVCTVNAAEVTHEQLISFMSGRTISKIYPHIESNPGEVVLELENIHAPGVINASLTVRRGEVVGLAGLVGCGKSRLLRAAFGLERIQSGRVVLNGKDHTSATPSQSLKAGYHYLSPDRKTEGLVWGFDSASNITLGGLDGRLSSMLGWLRLKDADTMAATAGNLVELDARNLRKPVYLLSGGNQQKVLFGKGLIRPMDLYVFDEPTVGVDVGTRTALYGIIKQLCEGGAAVVIISSDLPEVLHLSHRAYVMCRGEVMGELQGPQITESNLLRWFFGHHEEENLTTKDTEALPNASRSLPERALNIVRRLFIQLGVLPFMLILALLIFGTLSDQFLSGQNLTNLLRQSVYLILVSMGQMLVLVTGGFDLSVGTTMALTSVVSAMVMQSLGVGIPDMVGFVIVSGCLAGLVSGALIGLLNGVWVAWAGVSPFIVTLGVQSIGYGAALYLTGGVPVSGLPPAFSDFFGFGTVFGIPIPILITTLWVIAIYLLMNRFRTGTYLLAVGGNAKASALSGIDNRKVLLKAYVLCATLASISGLLLTARVETGEANLGGTIALESIAACVIAGVSLRGGIGRVPNVVMGAIFIGLVQNGMNLSNVGSYLQMVVLGGLLIIAVVADKFRQRMLLISSS